MSIIEFLRSINGQGQLWAANGQFLGVLSSNQYDPNSICNPKGIYGSSWSATSIQAEFSMYGSEYGVYSPYNLYSVQPPVIVFQNQIVLVVTRNPYAVTNGVQSIDPDLLFIAYSSNTHATPKPLNTYTQRHRNTQNFVGSLSQSFGLGLPMDQP